MLRRPIRLSVLLAGIPVLAIVPLLAFAGALLWMTWSHHQQQMRADIEQAVHTLAGAVDAELTGTVRRLETIAELPVLAVGRLDEFHWQMRQVLAVSPDWLDIALLDDEGAVLARAAAAFENAVPRPARPQRHPAFDTGRPLISSLDDAPAAGGRAVSVAVPVRRDGQARWALVARIDPKVFADVLARQQMRATDVTTLFDRRMRVLARSRDGAAFFGQIADEPLARAVDASASGTRRVADVDGTESVFSWRRLAPGWTVAAAMPTSLHDAPLRRSMTGLTVAGLLTLGLALWSSTTLGRRIGAAVEAASRDARLLAERSAVPPLRPSSIRQFDALSRSLHETGERLAALLQSERQSRLLAETANRSKDEFLAMLGHELRNPMSAINNASRLLRRDDLSAAQRAQMSAVLERQNAHMKRLVDDLLDVGRVLSGKIVIARERVDLSEVAEHAVSTMRVAGRLAGHHVRLSLQPAWVLGDAVRLEQVVTNLLGNAARYTPAGGSIELAVECDGDQARLRVRDSGIGMTPQMLARAFDLFAQGDQDLHRTEGGLGIGLTLTRRLLELHGGSIGAASDGPNTGSTFEARLPLAAAPRPVPRPSRVAEAA